MALTIWEIISVLIILLAILLSIVISVKSFKSYRERKETLTLLIAIGALFIALAMSFLVAETAFLTENYFNEFLAIYVFGATATVLSGCAAVAFCAFGFQMAFPKRAVVLTLITAIIAAVYVGFWLWDPTKYAISPPIGDGEIEFEFLFGLPFKFTPILTFLTLVPLMSIPIFVLLYYANKVRKTSPVSSKRAALLGIGGFALATAYVVELLGLSEEITTGFRSLFLLSSLLFYYALFKIKAKVK